MPAKANHVPPLADPSMGAPLVGCTTIDATTPNDYLDYARAGNPGAEDNESTLQAASNLLGQETLAPNNPANIVGHGAEGDIDTGQDWGEAITINNIDDWTPSMQMLAGKVTELYLFGCTVGAGEDGANLLFEIAKAVSAPVSAPTGLIYCDEDGVFTLEPGAQWQTATPTYTPPPIDPPEHPTVHQAVNSEPVVIASATYVPSGSIKPVSDDLALNLAKQVVWNEVKLPGKHGAKQTGLLMVKGSSGKKTWTRSLRVFNHVLLQDMDSTAYYYANKLFRLLARDIK